MQDDEHSSDFVHPVNEGLPAPPHKPADEHSLDKV